MDDNRPNCDNQTKDFRIMFVKLSHKIDENIRAAIVNKFALDLGKQIPAECEDDSLKLLQYFKTHGYFNQDNVIFLEQILKKSKYDQLYIDIVEPYVKKYCSKEWNFDPCVMRAMSYQSVPPVPSVPSDDPIKRNLLSLKNIEITKLLFSLQNYAGFPNVATGIITPEQFIKLLESKNLINNIPFMTFLLAVSLGQESCKKIISNVEFQKIY